MSGAAPPLYQAYQAAIIRPQQCAWFNNLSTGNRSTSRACYIRSSVKQEIHTDVTVSPEPVSWWCYTRKTRYDKLACLLC